MRPWPRPRSDLLVIEGVACVLAGGEMPALRADWVRARLGVSGGGCNITCARMRSELRRARPWLALGLGFSAPLAHAHARARHPPVGGAGLPDDSVW